MVTYAIVKQSDLETIFLFPPSSAEATTNQEALDRHASVEADEIEEIDDADIQDISDESDLHRVRFS